jgi:hypothetical protein
MSELDALDPLPQELKLSSGFAIELERLKARQFFKLLRIVTKGALPQLSNAGLFNADDISEAEFTARLVGVILVAIPEAEDETIEFIRSMAVPAGLITGRKLNKQDEERNLGLWLQFDDELDNPELDDLLTILEAIVQREASDIRALGKRLGAMFKMAQKTGQVPSSPSPSTSTNPSSEDSPEASISSLTNIRGRKVTSGSSRSPRSGNASTRSKSVASTNAGSESNG